MNSRETILRRIRSGLSSRTADVELPPSPEVWPKAGLSPDEKWTRFSKELSALSGETIPCATFEQAAESLKEILHEQGIRELGVTGGPLCRELVDRLEDVAVVTAPNDPDATDPKAFAALEAGLVEAEFLLADTGSCVVAGANPFDRLMCYLPEICVVVSEKNRLVEHLPEAWPQIMAKAVDPELRGEHVIISGPSRTADIEKILILGVHGPRRVIVLVIDRE
jgi:L-lactate dehydrogenase complex protein LldG